MYDHHARPNGALCTVMFSVRLKDTPIACSVVRNVTTELNGPL